MLRRAPVALLALVLVAGLAACSSKDASDVSSGTTAGASTQTTVTDTTAAAEADGTDTTPASTVDAGALAANAGAPASHAGSCPTQDDVDGMQAELESASGGDVTDIASLAAEYDAAFAFLAAYLPSDHQADLDTVSNAFSGYVDALSGVDLSNPDALTDDQKAALDAAGQQFDTPEVEAANTRIEDYFTQTCPNVNFDEGGSTSDTSPGG
jgi:hypothetical protein